MGGGCQPHGALETPIAGPGGDHRLVRSGPDGPEELLGGLPGAAVDGLDPGAAERAYALGASGRVLVAAPDPAGPLLALDPSAPAPAVLPIADGPRIVDPFPQGRLTFTLTADDERAVYFVHSGDSWDLRTARVDGRDGPAGVLVMAEVLAPQSGSVPLSSPDGRWLVWQDRYTPADPPAGVRRSRYAPADGSWGGRTATVQIPDGQLTYGLAFLDADTLCLAALTHVRPDEMVRWLAAVRLGEEPAEALELTPRVVPQTGRWSLEGLAPDASLVLLERTREGGAWVARLHVAEALREAPGTPITPWFGLEPDTWAGRLLDDAFLYRYLPDGPDARDLLARARLDGADAERLVPVRLPEGTVGFDLGPTGPGGQASLARWDPSGERDVFLVPPGGVAAERMTPADGVSLRPAGWSPDGDRAAVYRLAGHTQSVDVVSAAGDRSPLLEIEGHDVVLLGWLPEPVP